jgi:hypothetical protein
MTALRSGHLQYRIQLATVLLNASGLHEVSGLLATMSAQPGYECSDSVLGYLVNRWIHGKLFPELNGFTGVKLGFLVLLDGSPRSSGKPALLGIAHAILVSLRSC